ncbi:hypothetical protein BDV96DRAFT_248002 [Lophiotrema nucula]|uniref:RING-type domain-containing protein n=1 Tax=Lophiotrema nucula TaxID=690887 RepID=A0A6A5YPL0_9PLEO|nr:hypothetical protein BDV96DRAFT_248002 [Lophiotrema nucula]
MEPTMSSRPSPTPPAARQKNSASSITSTHASSSSSHPQAGLPSSSKTSRGTTPTASRSSMKAASGDDLTRPSSKSSLKQKIAAKKADEAPKPSKSDEQLKALKSDFDGLRSHLTCKICDRLLYQPYIISCGHTYCYSCLCTWFVSNKARKTCPDCRAVVTQAPAPAYIIREMTSVFIARVELLPSGETLEQHQKWQKEEADIVQKDKDNNDPRTGGLFKGCFKSGRAAAPPLRVLRDQEDGVDRCPMCSWELEDGECTQCGLFFDDNGELAWGDSFGGFSDIDEMSERSMSGEDLDGDYDMEDRDFDDYDEPMDGWQDQLGDESFMMRRFLEHGIPPHLNYGRRRPLSHSEAGSRRSYTHSVSDMYTEEMDTVEEEDEDAAEEDASLDGFIDDGAQASTASRSASSTPGRTPQPTSQRSRLQRRNPRVVESEASSSVSSVIEEEEDEEDQGPIRRGLRNRAQTRILNRANGSREPSGPPSSTSTDASGEQDLDEDTQALLRADGWMLQHDGPEDEMYDDDSDGGRTTVGANSTAGWDATAISNDRSRLGGSLTPTADRPRPNAPIRPPSRVSNSRFMDASRGLRRRSSVLSTSTYNHEDGEADDDNSDLDQDGDIAMAMTSLRNRRSRASLRNTAFSDPGNRFANRGFSQDNAIDLDTDDNSDNSQQGIGRRSTQRLRQQEYNPRISWMFADHQRALQEYQRGGSLIDEEPRSTTPIARPRTANRNRPSPAQAYSPFMPPAPTRLRTPLMDNSSNVAAASRVPTSPQNRAASGQTAVASTANNLLRSDRSGSVSSASNASGILTPGTSTPGTSTPGSQSSVNAISQAQAAAAIDMIDRPPSRVSARPPSVNSRRNATGISPVYPGFPHPTAMGLGIAGNRMFANARPGNPWGAFVQPQGVRPRNSRNVLRDQSSTATLRAANSRANIRDGFIQSPGMRQQVSRVDLRHQPSRRRLNNQSSTRTLRASEHARPPPSPTTHTSAPPQAANRAPRITPEERDVLARELINNRMRALGGTYQPSANPVRTNPFTQGFRRPSLSSEAPPASTASMAPQHIRTNSNESIVSISSSQTAQATPASPQLNRRRSNRNLIAPPLASSSSSHAPFSPPSASYTNSYLRARQGSLTGGSPTYESPLTANNRGMSPMVTAGNSGPLI